MPLPAPPELTISRLDACRCHSPLHQRREPFVADNRRVLVCSDTEDLQPYLETGQMLPAFEMARPRAQIFFEPATLTCGIVTCGGLCPGLNNVIRALVLTLTYAYGVPRILGVTVLLWLTGGQHGLQPGPVALLAAAALTALGVLDHHDVDAIDWNILILMWGGLSLGVAMEQSGLMAYVRQADLTALPGGPWATAVVIVLLAVGLSTLMSNTATAALLVPMALAVSLPGQEQFAI